MNDSLLVGVLDGLANLYEQIQPPAGVELVLVAIIGDLDPPDQLHDEIGPPRVGGARIQHPGNVGMIHHGQRLPLSLEAGNDAPGVHAQFDDLERHAAADRFFLLRHIDHATAALANALKQFVTADARAGNFGDAILRLGVGRPDFDRCFL